jgi:riboflavin kinase / FMN adenylyltransferase
MLVVSQAADLAPNPRGFSAAMGMFDGVHLGHQQLIAHAVREAAATGTTSVVITFEPHPQFIIQPDRVPLRIQTPEHRLRTLENLGVGAVLVHPFTPEFSRMSGEDYLRSLATDAAPLRSLCVGLGFHFGHQRSGDTGLMQHLGRELGFSVTVIPPVLVDGEPVSSSRVRNRLRVGDFAAVESLLGRPYCLESTVVHGDQLGRRIGFPTANLQVDGLELPPHGVYAVQVGWQGILRPGVLNLGRRPTLNQPEPTLRLEVHLLDADENLYGETLSIRWVKKLRDEQRFPDLASLKAQIQQDVTDAREALGITPAS